MMAIKTILLHFQIILTFVVVINGHARFTEPPSRASAWRYGFSTPQDYDDNGNNCGGLTHQYQQNDGQCGVCGDPWDQSPRAHEAGGIYATGTIVRNYTQGQIVDLVVDVTANHLGHMEFSICPVTDSQREVTQDCLDTYRLYGPDGAGPKFPISDKKGDHHFTLRLPKDVFCMHCVMQWKYVAGNNWDRCHSGRGALGCGPQEQFRACADIMIASDESMPSASVPMRTNIAPSSQRPSTVHIQPTTYRPPRPAKKTTQIPPGEKHCVASRHMMLMRGLDQWCDLNCTRNPPFCPASHCTCS